MDYTVVTNNWPLFAKGIWMTIQVSLAAIVLGFCIAFCVALIRTSRFRVLRIAASVYVEVLRNIPFVILLFNLAAAAGTVAFLAGLGFLLRGGSEIGLALSLRRSR